MLGSGRGGSQDLPLLVFSITLALAIVTALHSIYAPRSAATCSTRAYISA
jgi:hypothetical protein